jgi:HPt (histidine-containing phosphotransfer) domain-containing protein
MHILSRRQYYTAVARHLGQELYHPRPVRLILEALKEDAPPLILSSTTRVQTATRQCLLRPREMIYEPFLVRFDDEEDPEKRVALVDFQNLLMADSRVSGLRNQQMQQILTTVREGLMLVDRDFRVAPEYSSAAEEILGIKELANRPLPEILGTVMNPETVRQAEDYLHTLFNPKVIEKLIVKINPLRQVEATVDGENRYLKFAFLRSVEDGVIRRVLVRVEDATRQVLLAREVEQQEKKARARTELTFHLVRAEPGELRDFLVKLEQDLLALQERIEQSPRDRAGRETIEEFFRRVHALKGEAAMLGLPLHQERLHQFEEHLLATRKSGDEADLSELRPFVREVQTLLEESRSVIDQFRRLSEVTKTAPKNSPESRSTEAEADAAESPEEQREVKEPQTFTLKGIERLVRDLCTQLHKQARFVSHVSEEDLPQEYRPLLRDFLIQMVRNSLVHGIESPDDRLDAEKPLVGELQFAVRFHEEESQMEAIFQDDGRGLDRERIAEKARRRGLHWQTDEELYNLIFTSGFSTAETTTENAGRGIGMDLLRAQITEAGGVITPHSDPGVFCAFQVVLPWPARPVPASGKPAASPAKQTPTFAEPA